MVIPGDRIVAEEEFEDTDTESVETYTAASIGVIGESTPSPFSDIESPAPSIQSPRQTRSYGKAKSGKAKKVAQPPCGREIVYLPGDINSRRNYIY